MPVEIIEELKKLQTEASAFEYEKVKKIINEDFGDYPENIFDQFESTPIAAASIAQVHKAKLKSGCEVAIKVKRPGIKPIIEKDLGILKEIADLFTKHTKFGALFDLSEMVKEFRKTILNELDFENEARNIDLFNENNKNDKKVFGPKVKWIYTNQRVLTMEYIRGTKLSDYQEIEKIEENNKKKIAENIALSVIRQIIRDGFFHADPHPGNIIVQKDNSVCFIDFGMMGKLSEKRKKDIKKMFIGMISKNSRMVVDSIVTINNVPYQKNMVRFEKDIDRLLEKYLDVSIKDIKIDILMTEISKVAFKYNVKIMREFLLISKCLSTLQSITRRLYPDFNIYEAAKPITKELKYDKPNYDELKAKFIQVFGDYKDLFTELPYALVNFIKKIQDDNYSISLKIENDKSILNKINSMVNRISFSIILLSVSILMGCVVIGNSISTGTDSGAFNSIIQTFGMLLGIIIIIGLIISIIKSYKKNK